MFAPGEPTADRGPSNWTLSSWNPPTPNVSHPGTTSRHEEGQGQETGRVGGSSFASQEAEQAPSWRLPRGRTRTRQSGGALLFQVPLSCRYTDTMATQTRQNPVPDPRTPPPPTAPPPSPPILDGAGKFDPSNRAESSTQVPGVFLCFSKHTRMK